MNHPRTLGLLAIAAMALVAFVGTTAASAATSFTASATGKKLTESTIEKHVFTITGSITECSNITYSGVTEGAASGGLGFTSTTLKVTPNLAGCTAFGFSSTVTNNGCHWGLTPDFTTDITPASCNFAITTENALATCRVEITGGQTIGGVTYSNKDGKHIDVTFNSSGIKAHVTKSSGFCPLTVGTHETTYKGKSTFGAEGANIAVD